MVQRPKSDIKLKFANFFGALGYFFCSLQWIWVILLYFSFINAVVVFISPNSDNPAPTPPPTPTPDVNTSPLFMIVTLIIIAAMLALTVYAIYKMPSTLAKTSKKVVDVATSSVTNTVIQTQHKKDTKKVRLQINARAVMFIKLALITIPIILVIASQFLDQQIIDHYLAIYISGWLLGFSLSSFTTQYSLAYIFAIPRQKLR